MIIRPSGNFDPSAPDAGMIASCVREHISGVGRLAHLRAYYEGRHAITDRVRGAGLPNMRVVHAFPRYISTMAAGYLIGAPVRYLCDAQPDALERILTEYRRCSVDSLDAELARDASIYGRGVELLYADGEARPCSASIDPRDAFVVYNDSVEAQPLMGVYITPERTAGGRLTGFTVRVCTRAACLTYRTASLQNVDLGAPIRVSPHYFGYVPMIEYWNDEDERGGEFLNADDVRMEFTRSLPVNALENAQTLHYLSSILPQEELARRAMQDA